MFFTIIIAFISLMGLIVIHELGHFFVAKKFGVRVDEFGIGYPPRLYGKKIGETIYSLNLLPFGAFVRIAGETENIDDARSFSAKPIWQRALIIVAGVVSFWLTAAFLFSIVFSFGTRIAVGDNEQNLENPKVQILAVGPNSPAATAGLKPGDAILKAKSPNSTVLIGKVKEVQELTAEYNGQEIILTIQRGKDVFDIKITPRANPPLGEGPLGIALVRTALKSYPWYKSPFEGIRATINMTTAVVQGYGQMIKNIISKKPAGVELVGPVGTFRLLAEAGKLGASNFLQFIGMIAIYIALFNILPIPAVDGGKLFFLAIEAIRRKPISEKIEQSVTTVFFMLLLALMVLVTIKDVMKLF
ncbi:MAG: M50 family metallopeptidase [bacterium]|nr:M50 family metallopeptidase [bacterium]